MPEFRTLKKGDIGAAKALWEEAFPEDAGEFSDWYFQNRFCPAQCYGLFAGETLLSMGQVAQDALFVNGKTMPANFIRGVATAKAFEGRGYASLLLGKVLEELALHGQEISILKTFIHPFYRRLGYEVYSCRSVQEVAAAQNGDAVCTRYQSIEEISELKLEQILDCYRAYLRGKSGYLWRSKSYFRQMLQEALDVGGGILLAVGEPVKGYCIAYPQNETLFAEEMVASCKEQIQAFERAAREIRLSFSYLSFEPGGEPDAMARAVCAKRLLEQTVCQGGARIRVVDDIIKENEGTWQIEAEGKKIFVEKVLGEPDICLTAGELSVLCLGGCLQKELPEKVERLWRRTQTGIFEQY